MSCAIITYICVEPFIHKMQLNVLYCMIYKKNLMEKKNTKKDHKIRIKDPIKRQRKKGSKMIEERDKNVLH